MKHFKKILFFISLAYNVNSKVLELDFVKQIQITNNYPLEILSDNFLLKLKDMFNCNIFIETGTFLGCSASKASKYFDKVFTIEIDQNLYNIAKKNLSNFSNVKIYNGDSAKVLPEILGNELDEKIVFWLDAHYSGPNHIGFQTGKSEENTPIISELKAIKDSGKRNVVIVIDDMRCFDNFIQITDPNYMHLNGYPTLESIVNFIKSINNDYKIVILGDVMLAFTNKDILVSPLIQACTISRLYQNETNIQEVLNAEKIIANSTNCETDLLNHLFNTFGSDSNLTKYGCGRHYILWKALMLLNSEPLSSYKLFKYLDSTGFNHWRIKWYIINSILKSGKTELSNEMEQLWQEIIADNPEAKSLEMF